LIPTLEKSTIANSKVILQICEEGIPTTMRGQTWLLLLPDEYHMNQHIFETHKHYKDNIDRMIDADIPRTFPELNPLFEQIHSLSESLREILVAFS
jgi:hypothetical protein